MRIAFFFVMALTFALSMGARIRQAHPSFDHSELDMMLIQMQAELDANGEISPSSVMAAGKKAMQDAGIYNKETAAGAAKWAAKTGLAVASGNPFAVGANLVDGAVNVGKAAKNLYNARKKK